MNNNFIGTAYLGDVTSELVYGTLRLSENNDMSVVIDSTLSLDSSHLIIPTHLRESEVNFTVDDVSYSATIPTPLTDGVKVILLREGGGQRYVIIGVIG